MAGLPPRSRSRSFSASVKIRTTLETLQHMGFSKERAEKAIATTGNHGVQQAAEWLLSHVNDPLLDIQEAREYIIYLCPAAELRTNLQEFWEKSNLECGWNSAHVYYPHITLSPFFRIPNNKVDVIDSIIHLIKLELNHLPSIGPLGLHLFTQAKNFIGYFVKEPYPQYLEQLMQKVAEVFLKHGIDMKPQTKQIHMTLAFQYDPAHHETLMKMAQEVNLQVNVCWEIQIYSRIPDLKTAEVRRVIQNYQPVQDDELQLVERDLIYMDPAEHDNSPDGWFRGTSHLTGVSALFPGNFTVKCPQMEMWTLHRSTALPCLAAQATNISLSAAGLGVTLNGAHLVDSKENVDVGEAEYDNVWSISHDNVDQLYAQVNKKNKKHRQEPRKLYIIRHAERCDFAFYRTWFEKSFDSLGNYKRYNLNCPKSLVPRTCYKDFGKDSPLTLIGREQARITGEALREAGVSVSFVYCSPALRCVETATELIKAYGFKYGMFIEPGLLEWCGWYKPNLPNFLSPEELLKSDFPVDVTYKPYVSLVSLNIGESVEDFYSRSHTLTQHAVQKHASSGGNILLVGHSGTLDACTRKLTGQPARSPEQFRNITRACPYCCLCTAVEDTSSKVWSLVEPPIPLLTHGPNSKDYSWESLKN